MSNHTINTLLVLLITLGITGAGYFLTEVQQPAELQRIEDSKKLARLQQTELEQLFVEEAASAEQAGEVMRRWNARYKYVPAALKTPDVIQYLEQLSQHGFEQFEVQLTSQGATRNFKFYLFDVSGTAYYTDLYQFIWHLENNQAFYQISDLDVAHQNVFMTNEATGRQRREDMVSFSLKLKVFYAGTEGLSAPSEMIASIPEHLLPGKQPAHNSFYPIIRTDLPPNDALLVDVEKALLLSIAGDRAIFEDKNGHHILREGDAVYLGQIVKIDPVGTTVRATLNKGGLIEVVDVKMEVAPLHELSKGQDVRLVPSGDL